MDEAPGKGCFFADFSWMLKSASNAHDVWVKFKGGHRSTDETNETFGAAPDAARAGYVTSKCLCYG
eukprot:jgi/Botrbrau1/18831/Bobra.0662s0001.1